MAHVLCDNLLVHPGCCKAAQGKEDAKAVMHCVGAHREEFEFEFENYAGGPNFSSTPKDIIRRIEGYSRPALAEAFAVPELGHALQWQAKYLRQNSAHVSQTFMVDGLVMSGMSSGDSALIGATKFVLPDRAELIVRWKLGSAIESSGSYSSDRERDSLPSCYSRRPGEPRKS